MVEEAKRNEAEDRKRKDLADARNQGDSMAYQAEKALRDLGDKVPADDRQKIENSIKTLHDALQSDDVNRIRRLTEEVQQASHALSQQMYAQQAPPEGQSPSGEEGPDGPSEKGGQGEVVEGEFREA